MPRLPSRQSKQSKVLEELKHQSSLYSKKATVLSNLLEQAEQFLRQMPGKVSVQTTNEHSEQELGFVKIGGEWRLVLFEWIGKEEPTVTAVTQATILQKAQAAQLLPELYDLLTSRLTQGQEDIDRGLESLKDLPFLDFQEFEELIQDTTMSRKEDGDDIPF